MEYRNLPKSCGVYGIINNKNNKVYIGYSTNVRERVYVHLKHLQEGRHANEILQEEWKRDKEYFTARLLDPTNDRSMEIVYIQKYSKATELYNIRSVKTK